MVAFNGGASGMRVGFVLPPVVQPEVLWPLVDDIEAGGFDSIWVTDRTIAATPWLDSLTMLAAVAARARRCAVGTSVLVLARRNPVYAAHALATVAHLAPGRVIAGVGLGGLEPAEYEVAGVPLGKRAPLTDEYISLIRRLWTEELVGHAGEYCSVAGAGLKPLPKQVIPVWVGGSSPAALARAGRLGDGWLSIFCSPAQFRGAWAKVRQHATDVGRDAGGLTPATYLFSAIGRRGGEAEAVLEPAMRALFGAGLDQVGQACLYGTPDRWVQAISEFADAGARQVNVVLFSTNLRRDTELIASEVLPQIQVPGAPTGAPGTSTGESVRSGDRTPEQSIGIRTHEVTST